MNKLNWIDDSVLWKLVSEMLSKAKEAKEKTKNNIHQNVIDPFSAIFEMAGFDISYQEWIMNEGMRQAQKTLQNFVGEFHQSVLGSCKGWKNMETGQIIDLANEELKIVAEVKNKYNTLSGGKLPELYDTLDDVIMKKNSVYKGYTGYYVIILPKNPSRFDKPFTPSDTKKGQLKMENEKIRQIDGSSFYHLVTGSITALEDLYRALPNIIQDITKTKKLQEEELHALFKKAYGYYL